VIHKAHTCRHTTRCTNLVNDLALIAAMVDEVCSQKIELNVLFFNSSSAIQAVVTI